MSLSGITSVLAGSYPAQAQPGQGGQSARGQASFEQALNQTGTDPLQTQKAGHHHHHHHAASGSGASAASSASGTPDDGDPVDDQILAMLTNIENTLTNIENTLTGSGGSTGSTGSTATVTGNLTAISHVNILA